MSDRALHDIYPDSWRASPADPPEWTDEYDGPDLIPGVDYEIGCCDVCGRSESHTCDPGPWPDPDWGDE